MKFVTALKLMRKKILFSLDSSLWLISQEFLAGKHFSSYFSIHIIQCYSYTYQLFFYRLHRKQQQGQQLMQQPQLKSLFKRERTYGNSHIQVNTGTICNECFPWSFALSCPGFWFVIVLNIFCKCINVYIQTNTVINTFSIFLWQFIFLKGNFTESLDLESVPQILFYFINNSFIWCIMF